MELYTIQKTFSVFIFLYQRALKIMQFLKIEIFVIIFNRIKVENLKNYNFNLKKEILNVSYLDFSNFIGFEPIFYLLVIAINFSFINTSGNNQMSSSLLTTLLSKLSDYKKMN